MNTFDMLLRSENPHDREAAHMKLDRGARRKVRAGECLHSCPRAVYVEAAGVWMCDQPTHWPDTNRGAA